MGCSSWVLRARLAGLAAAGVGWLAEGVGRADDCPMKCDRTPASPPAPMAAPLATTDPAAATSPGPCPPACEAAAGSGASGTKDGTGGAMVRSPSGGALQVAGEPRQEDTAADRAPLPAPRVSDGAGPRLTFGRVWTESLAPGFYGRFETEYFEVRGPVIAGMLLGLEGWSTEDAKAGGGAIPASLYAGLRTGPFRGSKAPVLFLTVGAGVDAVVYDRLGDADGFGLLSPFGVVTAGVEVVPGLRLLADARAAYRWRWTSESGAQYQVGLTIGANSYLWDGP